MDIDELHSIRVMDPDEIYTPTFEEQAQHHNEFDEKEKMIMGYLTKNPGSTKQEVVNALDGRLSRATIFIIIKRMTEIGLINIEKEKPNSQVHRLFFNHEHILIKTIENLDTFQRIYLDALDKLTSKYRDSHLTVEIRQQLNIMSDFLFLFSMDYIRYNTHKATALWLVKYHKNQYYRDKLNYILFNRMTDIVFPIPWYLPDATVLDIWSKGSDLSLLGWIRIMSKEFGIARELNAMIKLVTGNTAEKEPSEMSNKGKKKPT